MGKSNRIRANRSEAKIAAPVKAKKKQGMPSWLLSLITILVTVAVLCTVAGGIISSTGVVMRLKKGVTSEHYSISGSMMTYYYHATYQNFDTNYESYMSYLSLDTSKSLKNQVYGDKALGGYEVSYLGEFDGTWYEYFVDMALESAKQVLVYCEEANARGIKLDDADHDAIDAELAALEVTAAASGYSTSQYISATYGKGVKVSDIRKCLELSTLASKAMSVIQDEILEGIKDTDISDKYNSAKDDYDLVDYVYFSLSANYESIAKELLGSDYTKDELAAKKDEVDAKYKEKVEEVKKVTSELEAIKDKDEFIKYVLTYNAKEYYDAKYKSAGIPANLIPSDDVLAAIKEGMVNKIVAEVLEGKTETTSDAVKDGDNYTLYDQKVEKDFSELIAKVKTSVFSSVLSDKTSYNVTKANLVSTNEFLKWAFESGRTVGEMKTVTHGDKPDESYSSAVYILTKTRYADETKTKNIAYMLFSSSDEAKKAIDKLKSTALTLDGFNSLATELKATTVSKIEEYIEGNLGIQSFDDWAFSDTIKVGDITTEPIEIEAKTTYLVGYYYEEADETWKVTVKAEIFSDRYNKAYEDLTKEYAVTPNQKTLNKLSDGFLPVGLRHSHAAATK